MRNKYFFIVICLIFCLLISITNISAATDIDNNVSDSSHDSVLTVDSGESGSVFIAKENKNTLERQDYNISSSKDNEANIETSTNIQSYDAKGEVLNEKSNGNDVVSDSNTAGTFTDLNTLISNTSAKGILKLTQDYTYNATSDSSYQKGIVINKPITIDGQGFTISGNNQAGIFNITANNVIIKNLNLINGNGSGGAIYWFGLNGVVTNCTFTNNSGFFGGAILWDANTYFMGSSGTISNCTFTNNTAERGGGAIHCHCEFINITGCTFTNNTANFGGAIHWNAFWGAINNCTFSGNNAITRDDTPLALKRGFRLETIIKVLGGRPIYPGDGGAIYWHGDGKIIKCIFEGNNATRNGTAIYLTVAGIISAFEDNKLTEFQDIYLENNATRLDNCGALSAFEDNKLTEVR